MFVSESFVKQALKFGWSVGQKVAKQAS